VRERSGKVQLPGERLSDIQGQHPLTFNFPKTKLPMIIFLKKRLHLLSLAICFIANHVEAQSRAQFNAQDFKTRSVFELLVNDSSVLKAGASKIVIRAPKVKN
jgi:hypothetical protein